MYERNGYIIQNKFKEYLVPTVLTSMAVSMASVVDGIIVGSLLGDVALAAIGLASPVIFCINLIYMLFAIGGITCASIAQGKRDFHQSNISFTLCIGGGLIVMSIFLAVMQGVLQPLSVSLAGGDMKLALLTEQYLRPLLFTGPALMFSSGMAMFIRTDGKPKASAVIVMISNGAVDFTAFEKYNLSELTCYMSNNSIGFNFIQTVQSAVSDEFNYLLENTTGFILRV